MSRSDDGNKAWRPPSISQGSAGPPDEMGEAGGAPGAPGAGPSRAPRPRAPIFNIPRPVVAMIVALVVIHAGQDWLLTGAERYTVYQWFGFVPHRLVDPNAHPGGIWALLWSPFTHALLHGSWSHLGFNLVWFAAFGSPVVRRYGVRGLALFGLAGAAIGAAGFAAAYPVSAQDTVMIGASGAVSAFTGAAIRFVFQPLQVAIDPESGQRIVLGRPLSTLRGFLRDRRALAFTVIWLGINLGLGVYAWFEGNPAGIAWQAHIAGYAAGFFLVRVFERPGGQPR